nr:RNA-directed DNA polymerase, eukaryota, reverse transcriptase zinc-binding domain protein [Tanacetum cinerariifolium]
MGKHPAELISSLPTLSTDDLSLANVVDRRIPPPSSLVEKLAHSILNVSRACLNYNPQERPTMRQVTDLLSLDDRLWMKMNVSALARASIQLGWRFLNDVDLYLEAETKCLSSRRVPSRVLQQLESIRNRFFNENDLGSKKATCIKWSNVLADKAKGGLSVSSLYALNRGLMIKWLWRFYAQNTSLWVRVVKAMHGEDEKVGQNISSRFYSCWLNIVKEVSVLQAKGVNVMNYVRVKLGISGLWKDLGISRSKEDDVAKIATSIYITNFPETISAKELFKSCKIYGHVVDSFIPNKRAKNGKANVGFRDNNMKAKNNVVEKVIAKSIDHNAGLGNSYVRVVKREEKKGIANEKTQPAMVLDDECLISRDLSNFLMGRVKEFASLANLKMTMSNEGFMDVKIQYLGEFWVMLEFTSKEKMKTFQANVSIGSWYSNIRAASLDFQLIKRIAWVENSNISDDDNDVERISEKVFPVDDQKDVNKEEGEIDQKQENVNKEEGETRQDTNTQEFAIPPGFSPKENYDEKNILAGGESVNMVDPADRVSSYKNCKFPKNTDESGDNSISSGHFKNSELPRTGGSILGVLEEVIKVGTVMGYKMKGCLAQKAKKIGLRSYAISISEALGNSGGILCIWDPNFFVKDSVMISDSFVLIRGKCCHTGQDLLIGVVYAPHDVKENYMLWDYLHCEIARWKGQVVIMGDFNEVRVKSDRYGSVFNAREAQRFNSFISNSGLVEINLGGCHYTWSHKSAKKMSKLDRFLVSENLINNSLNITAISLDRYLSDHRFNKIVEDAWKSHVVKDDNAIRYIMGKFKFVKSKIREWNASYKNEAKKDKDQCVRDLVNIDDIIEGGNGGEEEVLRRAEIVNKIQKIDGVLAKEFAQKTEINEWVDDPQQVKKELYDHFSARFFMTNNKDASILMDFPKNISESKLRGLECEVSNDEIKKAVWDCGTEKAPVKKKQALFFKVDFEKAYDSVRWDFLDEVLRKFGFGDKWCKWIQCCLNSSRGSILVNGSPTEEFQFGITLDGGLVNLSHMFYADDAVFIGQWCENNITTLVHVLDCIYKVSGLRINMSKSKIMGVHVDTEKVNRVATKLGCLVFKIPFAYLGSVVGGNMSRMHLWNETVDKVKKRLSKWKMNTLSIGGRLTLIKSVLSSTPLYHLSLFKAPMGVLNYIESLRSHFFNGHDIKSKKATWVNWKKSLVAKDRGGLGILSLYAMNRGLLLKWVWRFVSQKNTLWAIVIQALHGVDGKIGTMLKGGHRSCWTSIIQEMNNIDQKGIDFMSLIRIKLETGRRPYFGRTNGVLKPRGGSELDQLARLGDVLKEIILNSNEDRWVWDLESTGEFSVSSIRNLIDKKILPNVELKRRWNKVIPIKINIHTWKIMTNSLPTRFNISCRGICIDSILCATCDRGVETASHLFFSCLVARDVVKLITRWWCIEDVEVESFDDWENGLLLKWVRRFVSQKNTLWARVIQALHGVDGKIGTKLKGGHRSCWMSIIQEMNNMDQKGIDFMSFIRIKLGNGEKTRFWEEKWCVEGIESCKLISVGTKLSHPCIYSSFRRKPRGGSELDQLARLGDVLNEVILISNEDRWLWDLESTGEFSVSSIRNLIDKKILPNVELKT